MILIIILLLLFLYINDNKKIYEHFNNSINNTILENIFIRSGGLDENSNASNSVYLRYNDKDIIKRGSDGLNIVIIDRLTQKIKNTVVINTGIDYLQNDTLIDLIQNHINLTDVVIIAVKKDGFKQMNEEARLHLKILGAKQNLTRANASYILIGSKDNEIYYEKMSFASDVYYPYIAYHDIGCWKMDTNIITKKIKLYEFKKNNNNFEEYIEYTNRFNLVKTCSMIAVANKSNKFALTKEYCYILNGDHKKYGSGLWCSNQSGRNNRIIERKEYRVFKIDATRYTNEEIKKFPQDYIRAYLGRNYTNKEIILEQGIYMDEFFDGIELDGGLQWDSIKSIKIPEHFLVTLADDINYRRAITNHYLGSKNIPNIENKIEKVIVINAKHKVIFWSNDYFNGKVFALSYGRFIVPKEIQMRIQSINIKIPYCEIFLYFDENFSDLYGKIINDNNYEKNLSYLDNDRLIKSIQIVHKKN